MLEDLAWQFVSLDEDQSRTASISLTFVGFLLGFLLRRSSNLQLTPAPYFSLSAFLLMLSVLFGFVSLGTFSAAAAGMLWIVVGVQGLVTLAIGYGYGAISLARSRNGYGDDAPAFLAFIPIGNLFLLLKAPKAPPNAAASLGYTALSGAVGVVVGIALLGASVFATAQVERLLQSTSDAEMAQFQRLYFERQMENDLEGLIFKLAAQGKAIVPLEVDPTTTLISIEAEGDTLVRTYVVDSTTFEFTDLFRGLVLETVCSHAPFLELFNVGASIREVYRSPAGDLHGQATASLDTCSN